MKLCKVFLLYIVSTWLLTACKSEDDILTVRSDINALQLKFDAAWGNFRDEEALQILAASEAHLLMVDEKTFQPHLCQATGEVPSLVCNSNSLSGSPEKQTAFLVAFAYYQGMAEAWRTDGRASALLPPH